MRTLELTVTDKNEIEYIVAMRDPVLNRSNIGLPMRIKINFPSEWDRAAKVMAFYTREHKECTPQVIENDSCIVPLEALKDLVFFVEILGKKNGKTMKTNRASIYQNGFGGV